MNRRWKFLTGIFAFCLLFQIYTINSYAAGRREMANRGSPTPTRLPFMQGIREALQALSGFPL